MRLLLVSSRFPLPSWRGNQVRTMEWIAALAAHELGLVCPEPKRVEYGRALSGHGVGLFLHRSRPLYAAAGVGRALLRGLPLQEGLYGTAGARRALEAALADRDWDLVVVQMVRCAWAMEVVATERPALPILFDAIDAMGLHYRRAVDCMRPPLRFVAAEEARRCQRRESWAASRARMTTAVAARDLAALGPLMGRVVPVAGRHPGRERDAESSPVVLLSGNLGYRPTVLGALWFADAVWPELRRRVPGARWVLAGARPSRRLRRLERLDGVEVHGDVPDLGPFVAAARVAIAPLSSGSGIPIKVLEAWAAGVPVVADPWCADALGVEGKAAVAVARSAAEWVEELTRLLSEPDAARELVERGMERWRAAFHPDRVAEEIRAAVASAISG